MTWVMALAEKRGPGNAGRDDENAEDLDAATDDPDRVVDYRLKS